MVLFVSKRQQQGNVSPCGLGLWKPSKNTSVRRFVMRSSMTFVAKSLQKRGLCKYPPRFCGGLWTWWQHLFGLDGGIHGLQVTVRTFFLFHIPSHTIYIYIIVFLFAYFIFVSINTFSHYLFKYVQTFAG